jgi:hypothetical protein
VGIAVFFLIYDSDYINRVIAECETRSSFSSYEYMPRRSKPLVVAYGIFINEMKLGGVCNYTTIKLN